ncbi:MAG: hypothetical protein DRR08_15595 [Candidatus Parabeggiatoa sp. nov. 2]|nr:MAG: hypothetical protein DRR08_15595 [Gammaproteobacteria bacterium]
MRLPLMFSVLFTISVINTVSAAPSSESFAKPFWFVIAFVIGLIAVFKWLYKDNHSRESHENPYRPPKMMLKVNRVNKEHQPDFRAELIRFLKSHGYPAGGIFCNAKIGETHVDYLITVPNSNEKLAIINAQRLDDNPAQLKRQLEMCRQKMGEPDYPVSILTANDEANRQYPFALYYLEDNGIFKEVSLESFPTF